MELEFQEIPMQTLRERIVEVLYQEETAELIVPDSSPDVAAIADYGAVCCLRDQEVLDGSMAVSGAFQASVLYTAEDGVTPYALQAYLPFTTKLMREEIGSGDKGIAEIRMRSVDARILNSRKIMVRVSYAVRMTVYTPETITTWKTEPDDRVQLLHRTVTGVFPVAAAEKQTTFSESIELPTMGKGVKRILKSQLELQWNEQKPLENKAILKGNVLLHLLYELENGQLEHFDVQIPISQYLEFAEDISDGVVRLTASVRDYQIDPEEDAYLVTIGLCMQAVIWKQIEIPTIADGYCIGNALEADYETYQIRQSLDHPGMAKNAEGKLQGNVQKMVDCTAWVDFPVCRRSRDAITVEAAVTLHALYYDPSGMLRGESIKTSQSDSFALSEHAVCYADADPSGSCFVSGSGTSSSVSCGIGLHLQCFSEQKIQSMKSASVGDALYQKDSRPSLVVRRVVSRESLWNLAKQNGSTVRVIQEANKLDTDTAEENMLLLIPMV